MKTKEPCLISIITPTLNEEETLPFRRRELREQSEPWEWIVADGGSRDGTVKVAEAAGARVLRAPCGRGPQLNAGAAAASGQVLLFLHADTVLPPGALEAVRAALADPTIVGGNFRLRFEGSGLVSVVFTTYYWLQQRLFRMYYGDSVLFVRREVFECLQGYPDVPIMEDYEFVRKLERVGRTRWLPLAVTTSARRYRGRVLRTVARWASIQFLYRVGVPAGRLARLYPAPGEGGDG